MRLLLNRRGSEADRASACTQIGDNNVEVRPTLLTQFAVDEGRTEAYRQRPPQLAITSVSRERAPMSSQLRLVRDDEERLSVPGFTRPGSPSRLGLFGDHARRRRAQKLAQIENLFSEKAATMLEAVMDNMLREG